MTVAIKRFTIVLAVLAISVLLSWGFIRARGLSTIIHPPLLTGFLQNSLPTLGKGSVDLVIYHPFGEPKPEYYTLERLRQIAKEPKEFALWLDVHPLLDGTLVVGLSPEDSAAAPTLAQGLAETAGRRLILNFSGYRAGILEKLSQALEARKASDRILIESPEDGFLKDARADQPLWLYGTSQTQGTLMVMMSSIGLESMSPFRGDVFVMEDEPANHLVRLSDAMIAEIHRRQRKFYAGPATASEAKKLSARGVDGILMANPSEFSN